MHAERGHGLRDGASGDAAEEAALTEAMRLSAQDALVGAWRVAVAAFRKSGDGNVRLGVYGCGDKVRFSDQSAFMSVCGRALAAWGYARSDTPIVAILERLGRGRVGGEVVVHHPVNVDDNGYCVRVAIGELQDTAARRAAEGVGPRLYEAREIEEWLESIGKGSGACESEEAKIAQAGRRGVGIRVPYFVCRVGGRVTEEWTASVFGRPGVRSEAAICRSGEIEAAAARVVRALGVPGQAFSRYILGVNDATGVREWRATGDGEDAIKFMHMTERARLRGRRV